MYEYPKDKELMGNYLKLCVSSIVYENKYSTINTNFVSLLQRNKHGT